MQQALFEQLQHWNRDNCLPCCSGRCG
uniref:Uncharacterized protein n=1 Tax=Arundo donax TaxID=35708 RepID=A0A0A9NAE9_ARUDO